MATQRQHILFRPINDSTFTTNLCELLLSGQNPIFFTVSCGMCMWLAYANQAARQSRAKCPHTGFRMSSSIDRVMCVYVYVYISSVCDSVCDHYSTQSTCYLWPMGPMCIPIFEFGYLSLSWRLEIYLLGGNDAVVSPVSVIWLDSLCSRLCSVSKRGPHLGVNIFSWISCLGLKCVWPF